ncbi:hypothetical protein MMC34_000554 [Xylographa carneopallida]|nr:hypothetical protein [Xylographa carneopallida]
MKSPTALALLLPLLAVLVSAAPTPATHEARQFQAQITFSGAAGASYTLSVPTDGSDFPINNPLSVSSISLAGGASCGFVGIDGSETTVVGADEVAVGPPQVQVSGSCLGL